MLRNRRSNRACRKSSRRARLGRNSWEEVLDSGDVSSLDDLSENDSDVSNLDDSSEASSVSLGRRAVRPTRRRSRRVLLNRLIRNDPNEPGPSNASSSSGNSRSDISHGAGKRKHKAKSPRILNSETSSDDMFATNERAPKRKRPRRTELITDEDSESSTNLPVSTQRHCIIQSSSDDSIDSLDIAGQRMRRRHAHLNFLNDSDTSINEDLTESGRSVSPVLVVDRRSTLNGRRYLNTLYMTLNGTDTSSSSGSTQNSTSSSSSSTSSSSSSSSSTSSSSSMSSDTVLSYESVHSNSTREQQILSSDSDSSDSEGDKCAICLKKFRNQRIGNPSDCDHNFCFTCLMEWSKTSTTCPVDRSPFDAIIVREEPNGNMVERIKVQARVFEGFSGLEEVFNDTISCEICGSGDDENYLLLCDTCNSGYHMGCLRPPLVQIPDGSWFCPECRTNNRDNVNRNSGSLTERLMAFMQDLPMSISSRRPVRNRMRNTRTRLVGPPPRGRGPTLTRSRNHTTTNFSMEIVSSVLEERVAELNTPAPTPQLTSPIVQKSRKRRFRARRQLSRLQLRNVSEDIGSKIRLSRRNDTVVRSLSDRNSDTIVETVFPSFNLFEDDATVLLSDDNDGEDILAGEVATMSRVRSEFSARRIENRKNIVSSLVSAAYRQRTRPVTPPVLDETEPNSVNLLDSILESQTLWHSKNVDITATQDGKLNIKLKPDEENKPDLKNTNHQSKEIPLFPGGSKNESNSSSPSDGNKSYANNSRYSELGGGGGGGSRGGSNTFGFSGASLNSLNPSTRPGFSNILGNNSSAVDLSPFRGAAPIRFRMNPPRPALRRPNFNAGLSRHLASSTPANPLNLSSTTTTTSPQKLNAVTADSGGGENEDEVDLYDDIESETVAEVDKPEMFASLKPPPEPPAMLMGCESSSDEDNDGWVIDDANSATAANRSNIYDPTEPNEDSDVESDCADQSNANIAPGYLRSPSYGGISEFGPHLPLPKPPALPIELDSANNSEEEDEAECPNMTLYSSTSISLANNVQDIPIPESRPDDLDCIPIPPFCEPSKEPEMKTINLYSPTAKDDDSKSDSDVQSVHSISIGPQRRSSSDESASSSEEQSISNDSDIEERTSIRYKKSKKKEKKSKEEVIEPIEYYGESSDESDRNDSESRVAVANDLEEELLQPIIGPIIVPDEKELTVDLTESSEKLKEDDEIEVSKNESEEESEIIPTTTEEKEEEEPQIVEAEMISEEKQNDDNDNAARIAKIVDEVRNSMEENAALAERQKVEETTEQTEPNASTACLLPSDDLDPVSDVEYNDFVDYRKQSKDRKKKRKKTRRRTDISPGRARELEEGEIDDEQKKRQRSPLRKRRKSRSPSISMVAGEKKQKRKRDRKEKGDKENKDQDFQWKKLSKNTKERNYRAGKSKPDSKGRDRNRKEKRKEIERYNVRKMLSDKPRRDKFGRDLSMGRSPRTKSRSLTPQSRSRSRSPSAGAKNYTEHHRRGSKTNTFRKSFSQEDRWIDWSPVWSQRRSRSRTRRTRSRSRSRQRTRLSSDRYRNRSKNRDHNGRKRRRSVSSTLNRFSPVSAPLTTKKRRHSRVDQGRKSAANYAAPSAVSEYFYERSWSRTMSYASLTPEPESYPYERSPSIEPTRLPQPVSVERDIIAPNPQNLTVIVPNVDAGKKKHKKKKDSKKKKKKQPSKEVFTSGDNIVVSVNFDDNQKTISAKSSKRKRTATVVGTGQVEEAAAAPVVGIRKKKKDDSSRKKRKQTLQVSEEVLNAKPVAVIDLNSSPCKEMSPTEVISLTDSGDEDNTTTAPSKENASRSRPVAQQSGATVESHRSYVMTSAGPKTPPEPPIKFTVTSGPMRSLPTNPIFEQDEELDNGEEVSVAHYNKGPNTPPESLGSGIQSRRPLSPNGTMYDPFEPTKSRSASPEGVRATNESGKSDHVDMFADDGDKSNDNQNASTVASGEHESGDSANTDDKIVDLDQDDITSSPKTNNADENTTKISPNKEAISSEATSSSNAIDSIQQANVVLDLTSLGDEFVPKSSIPLVKTSQGKYEFQGGKIPDKPITVVIAQQSTPIKPQPQQVMVTPTRQIPAKTIEPIKQPMFPDILPWKLPPQTSSYSTPPSTITPQQKSTPAGATQNGSQDCDIGFELDDSPYSPASSEGDDLFEPPPLNSSGASSLTARGLPLPPINSYKSRVDALFSSSPAKKLQSRSASHPSRTIGSHKSMSKKITKTIAHNKKDNVGSKADEEQLRILDDVPNSAVEMIVKEKFLKKLHRQERVNEEVKVALKPHYAKKHITKEEYKDIMRKAVPKICHNKSGDINPSKIQSLVEAYVKKVRHSKKKGSTLPGSTGPPLFPNMAAAKSVKKQKSLWG